MSMLVFAISGCGDLRCSSQKGCSSTTYSGSEERTMGIDAQGRPYRRVREYPESLSPMQVPLSNRTRLPIAPTSTPVQ